MPGVITTPIHAVIVEPRPHPALSLVLCNLFQVLGGAHQQLGGGNHEPRSNHTTATIFHGTQNRDFVSEAIREAGLLETKDSITCAELPGCQNLTVPEYSRLLCNTDFWRRFAETHILIFQTDSILSETSPVRINEFLDFAYIGAPWRHLPQFRTGGNGGLSLRQTTAMVEACQCFAQDPFFRRRGIVDLPEDVKFALYFRPRHRQYRLPDRHTSARFSVESVYEYPRPLGIHKAWKRLPVREWQILKKQDPWFAEIEKWQELGLPAGPPQNSKP